MKLIRATRSGGSASADAVETISTSTVPKILRMLHLIQDMIGSFQSLSLWLTPSVQESSPEVQQPVVDWMLAAWASVIGEVREDDGLHACDGGHGGEEGGKAQPYEPAHDWVTTRQLMTGLLLGLATRTGQRLHAGDVELQMDASRTGGMFTGARDRRLHR